MGEALVTHGVRLYRTKQVRCSLLQCVLRCVFLTDESELGCKYRHIMLISCMEKLRGRKIYATRE